MAVSSLRMIVNILRFLYKKFILKPEVGEIKLKKKEIKILPAKIDETKFYNLNKNYK